MLNGLSVCYIANKRGMVLGGVSLFFLRKKIALAKFRDYATLSVCNQRNLDYLNFMPSFAV